MSQQYQTLTGQDTVRQIDNITTPTFDALRTTFSGTAFPTVTQTDVGLLAARTDSGNQGIYRLKAHDGTTATWEKLLGGPNTSTAGNVPSFSNAEGNILQDSGKSLPSGDIVGTSDTQTLENKTISSGTFDGGTVQNLATDLAIIDGGTGASSATAGFNALSPATTKGDIIVRGNSDNERLAVGTNDQVLTADSTTASGLAWKDGGGGGGLELQVETADFTIQANTLHYISSSSIVIAKLPASLTIGDTFAVVSGIGSNGLIYSNESATIQYLSNFNSPNESVRSSSNSIFLGAPVNHEEALIGHALSTSRVAILTGAANLSNSIFIVGGAITARVDTIDKFDTNIDAIASSAISIPSASSQHAGSSGLTGCYFFGGNDGSQMSSIFKIAFTGERLSELSSTLAVAKDRPMSVWSSTNSYVVGGTTSSITGITQIEKFSFSSELISSVTATLSQGRYQSYQFQSDSTGYVAGGLFFSGSIQRFSSIEAITFSTDSVSTESATLSQARGAGGSFASSTSGYSLGGSISSGNVTSIEKFVFSSGTNSTIAATISVAKGSMPGSSSLTKGYIFGGSATTDVIESVLFSTDAASVESATLSEARHSSSSASTSL